MAFAQLTYRESLRDIEACLRSLGSKVYHMGFRGTVPKTTLADAKELPDWRIYADFAQFLIRIARPLYARDPIGVELDHSLYALDSTTIDLRLSLFPWAKFRRSKAAVKMHTLLDLHHSIPTFIRISEGKLHDVNGLDDIDPEAGAFYVMDCGYLNFESLVPVHAQSGLLRGAYQTQCPTAASLLASRGPADGSPLRSNRHPSHRRVREGLPGPPSSYQLPRLRHRQKTPVLDHNFNVPALAIANVYRCRWQVELFSKWIKQHLRIKSFFGTSENAVKTQIWIAVSVYVLVAIARKRLGLEASLYQILQVLSVTLF